MKKQLVLGTKNKDKLRELKRLMKGSGIKVLSLQDFTKGKEAAETGKTFDANARIKARAYSRHTQALTLADDSGLMINALNGKPGVYSARFAGPGCAYQDNNAKALRLLKNTPAAKRKAKFVCVMALYDAGKFVASVRGECAGKIAFAARGKNGFGYDPIFIPRGRTKTYAQLSKSSKNKISHRARALRAAIKVILKYLKTSCL